MPFIFSWKACSGEFGLLSQMDGFLVPFPSVSSLAPGFLFCFAFTFYRFGQTLSYNKLQNSTIVLKNREFYILCDISCIVDMLNLHSALYGKKIKREKLLIKLHTNSSFEGTAESLRLSMLKTYT